MSDGGRGIQEEQAFAGKVAFVTGAGSGIGAAVAEAFAAAGASVVLAGRTLEKLQAVAARLPPERSLALALRHEDPPAVEEALARAVATFGGLDVVVNNAGIYAPGGLAETAPERWREVMEANVAGPFLVTRAALPHLRRRGRAAIVNVASSLALQPVAGAAAYCASKAALLMLTRVTALEEARHGVRAVAVCPGVVDTPIHRQRVGDDPKVLREFLDGFARAHPLGRVGTPAEVAALVLFLASERSSWTTGAVVAIDGGISLL